MLARFTPLSTRNLRLLFRAVDAELLRSFLHSRSAFSAALGIVKRACLCSRLHENSHGCHTVSRVPPTHRGRSRLHSKPSARFYYSSATLTPSPSPDARCADALTPLRQSANHFTHSESTYGLEQGQVGLLSEVQAPRQKACRYVPPRHLPFALILCRHSEFPAFLWLTSLPLRATSSSPHIATSDPLI